MPDTFYAGLNTQDLQAQVQHLMWELENETDGQSSTEFPLSGIAARDKDKLRSDLGAALYELNNRPDATEIPPWPTGVPFPDGVPLNTQDMIRFRHRDPPVDPNQPRLPPNEVFTPSPAPGAGTGSAVEVAEKPGGADTWLRPPVVLTGVVVAVVAVFAVSEGAFHFPINFSGSTGGGGGPGATGNRPITKDPDAGHGLTNAFAVSFDGLVVTEDQNTITGNITFSQNTVITVTTKPVLATETDTTESGATVKTIVGAGGKGCTEANGTNTPIQVAPLIARSAPPWAFLFGFTGATYGLDTPVGRHTDWTIDVTLPYPDVQGRTFSLNSARVLVNSTTGRIERIDQHATWTDSQAATHQPDLHRDLTASLHDFQYDTGARVASCP